MTPMARLTGFWRNGGTNGRPAMASLNVKAAATLLNLKPQSGWV
jgi:hypothetical protein